MRQYFFLFFVFALFAFTEQAFALTQYRCSGVVQYRPCNDDRAIPALVAQKRSQVGSWDSGRIENSEESESPRARMKSDLPEPVVFSTKYKFNSDMAVGVWTGFVYGEGPVVLRLRLNVPGAPPEVRYMGRAVLRGKTSPFEFRSTPPKGSRWNWYISAKSDDS